MFLINPYILQASGNPLWDGLLAYYTADNTGNDALGSYDLTLYNGTTYTTGVINNGFSFDGVNDYAETTATRIGHGNSDSFTISCWINGTILNRGLVVDGDTVSGGTLGTWSDGVSRKIALLKGQSSGGICFGNTTLSSSTLYHLVVVHTPYDGVSSNVQFYVNGSDDGSVIFDIGTPTASTVKQVGTKSDKAAYFTGMIDEPAIWSRDLSASEVTELYNSGAGKQYPTGIDAVWSDLLAYYTADSTPNDALGNFNGTLTNGATYGTGIISNGFSLDGVNDTVDFGNNLDFDGSTPFSVSCWINTNNVTSSNVPLAKAQNLAPFTGYWFLITSTGNLRFILSNDLNSPNWLAIENSTTLSTSTWYHCVMTYDGSKSSTGLKVYVDNALNTQNVISNTLTGSTSNSINFKIGARNNGFFYNGLIDEVAVFNKELSASEVTELYNSGAAKQYPN